MDRDEFIKLIEEKVPKGGKIYVIGVGLFGRSLHAPIISKEGFISNIDNELYLTARCDYGGWLCELACSNGYMIEKAISGRWVITSCSRDHPGWVGSWMEDECLGEYDLLEKAIQAWSDLPDRRTDLEWMKCLVGARSETGNEIRTFQELNSDYWKRLKNQEQRESLTSARDPNREAK